MSDLAITAIKDQIEALCKEGTEMVITDNDSFAHAGEFLRKIKQAQKQVDDTRKGMTRPLDESKKKIMDLFRPVEQRIEKLELSIKGSLMVYQAEIDRKIRIEREELDRKNAEEMAQKQKDAEFFGESGVDIEPSTAESMPVNVAPVAVGISTKTVWAFEIVDESKLPREMLSADEKKIRAAVEFGMRNVPGLRIFEKQIISARR